MHQQYRAAGRGQGGKKGEPGFRENDGKQHDDAACQKPHGCPIASLGRRLRRGSWHRTFRRFARFRSSGQQRGKNRTAQCQCKRQPDHPAVQMVQGACRSLRNKDSKPVEHPDVKEIRKGQARDSRSGNNRPEACGTPGPWRGTVSGIGILHRRRAITRSPPWKPPRHREVHAPHPGARQLALQTLAGMPMRPACASFALSTPSNAANAISRVPSGLVSNRSATPPWETCPPVKRNPAGSRLSRPAASPALGTKPDAGCSGAEHLHGS